MSSMQQHIMPMLFFAPLSVLLMVLFVVSGLRSAHGIQQKMQTVIRAGVVMEDVRGGGNNAYADHVRIRTVVQEEVGHLYGADDFTSSVPPHVSHREPTWSPTCSCQMEMHAIFMKKYESWRCLSALRVSISNTTHELPHVSHACSFTA